MTNPKLTLLLVFALVGCFVVPLMGSREGSESSPGASSQFIVLAESVKLDLGQKDTEKLFGKSLESLGYSELRVFVSLFAEGHETSPLTENCSLEVNGYIPIGTSLLCHASEGIAPEYYSQISGVITVNVISPETSIKVFARELPKGKYTVSATCYLVR